MTARGKTRQELQRETEDLRARLREAEDTSRAIRNGEEEALRQSEQNYREIFNAASDAIFIHDPGSGAIVDVNDAMLRMFGFSREEALRLTPNDSSLGVSPYSAAEARQWIAKTVAEGPQVFEWQARKKGGELFWVEVALKSASISRQRRVLALARDITKRKRAEAALREREQRLASIYDTVGDVIFQLAVDKDGRYRFASVNRAFLATTGLTSAQVVGKRVDEVIPEPSLSVGLEKCAAAIREKGIVRWEETSEYPAGRLTGEASIVPVFDETGHCTDLVGAVHDITERKRAEEALRERMKQLTCLYAIHRDIQAQLSIAELCRRVIEHLVPAMQFPEITIPVIELDGRRFVTERYTEGLSHGLDAEIRVGGEARGHLRVYYAEDKPFLIPEEQDLLNAIAERLGLWLERKEAEDALRDRETRYRQIVTTAQEGIWLRDAGTKTSFVNRRMAEMLGYGVEEMIGRSVFDFTDEAAREEMERHFKQRKQGIIDKYDFRFRRKDGSDLWTIISASPLFDDNGQFIGALGMITDITERKRAQDALKAERQRLYDVLETMPLMVCLLTPDHHVAFANRAFREKFGESHGRRCYEYRFGKKEPCDFCETYRVIETAKPHHWQVTTPDGASVLDVYDLPFADADGSPMILEVEIDITERKKVEAERERLLGDLEAKNRELESFVYTVSHDLKSPLVSLNGFSHALQKECYEQLGEKGKHYLERIHANVTGMNDLIARLLELSRIGQVVGAIEEVDVAALLRDIRDKLAAGLEKARAEFIVQEPLPTVRADRGRIQQVFVNLIDNAIKFRSAERTLRIEVGCRQQESFYRFHVADNGIGIAPQYHEQIFAHFRKLHPEIEGVGMGLALVKKIVEHHGGRVRVQSPSAWLSGGDEGTGATFYFTLPAERGIEPRDVIDHA